MLQIYIYGPQEQGFLELPIGASLDLETLAEPFDEDLSIGEYSLPIEVEWTEKNKRLFGFAERLQNFESGVKEFKGTVYDDFIPEIPIAKITILEKSGLYTYKKGRFNITISGGKGLFGSAIKNKKLRSFYFNGPIIWSTGDSRKFAEDCMKGVYPQYNYIAFAPVAIEGFIDTQRRDYVDEFLAKDCVNNVMVTGSGADDWVFDRPDEVDETIPETGYQRMDFRTVPFFNLMYVFKELYKELGYTPTGDFVTTTDFDQLYIFNNYGIENYAISTFTDFNRSIFPANHLPDITTAEFLKAVLDCFNMFPIFAANNEIKLMYRNQGLSNKTILSINHLVSADFQETLNDTQTEDNNGFKLAFKQDPADQYFSERAKDIADKVLVGTVNTFSQLATFNPGTTLTTDCLVYVQADNMYYQVADATNPADVKYDAYAELITDYTEGNGERTVDIGLGILATYVEADATTSLQTKRNYVGTRQLGSYRNVKNTIVLSPFSFRIFYISKQVIGGVNIPTSYNHNKNASNTTIQKYSLSWHGSNGLAQFHTAWQRIRQKSRVLKTNLLYDQKVLTDLSNYNTYEIDNVLFLPYRINRRIPKTSSLEIRLVPL